VCASAEPALAAAGIRCLTVIPVQVHGTLIAGALGLVDGHERADAPTLKRAQAVADLAGSLIERGMLYQDQLGRMRMHTEMDLARAVQMSLLPQRAPTIPGLDIFARAIPALHVGGDLYDFVVAQDGSLIFSLGDVTGKGISAARIMAMTRTALRTKATFLPRPDPLAIINRANQDLYDDFTMVEMFATVIVGQILPCERRLRLANAGHAPVILRRSGEAPRLIEAGGIPLGVLPEPLCELQSEPFGPGDLLVVASDGLTEAQADGGEMYGIERLIELIAGLGNVPASAIGEVIFAAVADYSRGQPQSDDQTLMIIRGMNYADPA
jgi:sigma-B regulation protein RsbU (phosphoserine phosphatase)